MKKNIYLFTSTAIFVLFVVFTILVKTVDVQYIYSRTYLGFKTLNFDFCNWVVNFGKYDSMKTISDVILYIAIGYSAILAIFGVIHLIKVKSLKKVDPRYYLLAGGYLLIILLYFFFEIVKVNFSPESYGNNLKASYPSSHVFIGSSLLLLNSYTAIKLLKPEKKWLVYLIYASTILICLLLVFTRLLSLKHWLTDIIASVILTGFVFNLFIYLSHLLVDSKEKTSDIEN